MKFGCSLGLKRPVRTSIVAVAKDGNVSLDWAETDGKKRVRSRNMARYFFISEGLILFIGQQVKFTCCGE